MLSEHTLVLLCTGKPPKLGSIALTYQTINGPRHVDQKRRWVDPNQLELPLGGHFKVFRAFLATIAAKRQPE
jgi:hypothetical protein